MTINGDFILEETGSEKLKSLLKVTALVSELKFKHHSLDYSSRFITLIPSHPFTPQHPRAHRPVKTYYVCPPGVRAAPPTQLHRSLGN